MLDSLYAVVVNWNLEEDTLARVDSLFTAGAKVGQVFVVDNGSADDSIQTPRQRLRYSVHPTTSEQNLGFAGGCNLGIHYALEPGADWVLVLNNDAYVARTFLTEIENPTSDDEHFAVIGPIMFYHSLSGSLVTESPPRTGRSRRVSVHRACGSDQRLLHADRKRCIQNHRPVRHFFLHVWRR